MSFKFAARTTFQSGLDSALTISGTFVVYGIVINETTNTAGTTVTVATDEASPTTIFTVTLSGRESFESDIPFHADKGLRISASGGDPTDVTVTVFHSNTGV